MSTPTEVTSGADDQGLDEQGLDAEAAVILVRAIRDAATAHSGADLDHALDVIGWVDALDVAPGVAVPALFDQQGRTGTTSGALGRLLRHALELPPDAPTLVLLPAFGSAEPPAPGGGLRGLGTADIAAADRVALLTLERAAVRWCAAPTSSLELRVVGGLDPRLGLVEVAAGAPVAADGWAPTAGSWDEAVAICRLAVGHELVGAMRTMLELARSHALDRVQFDRPIAGFQAVRHRLAEALVAVETAEAALGGAWDDGSPLAAALAKVVCGESARTVRRHTQQVLAGIGFTDEHDLHLYVRRTIVLDGLFGDARTLAAQIGADVLSDRRLPRLLPL